MIEWLPTERLFVDTAAWPLTNGCTPSDVAPSKNSTLPVAALGTTVDVNITIDAVADGVWSVATVTVVLALLIVTSAGALGADAL